MTTPNRARGKRHRVHRQVPAARPDERTIQAALTGETQALDCLFHWLLMLFAERLRRGLSRAKRIGLAKDDATQIACLAILQNMNRFRGGDFVAWVTRVASARLSKACRCARRKATKCTCFSSLELAPEELQQARDVSRDEAVLDPLQEATDNEGNQRAASALKRLPAVQREIVKIVVINGYSQTACSHFLGLDRKLVRKHLCAALQFVRNAVVIAIVQELALVRWLELLSVGDGPSILGLC